ncbi:hypothetical protein C731_1144 [Mycolicibacterium hassiacum DSM 44199]|uniref:Uncharacterized protein n=1 Tax=Mycolicibacterium hassiacum (strain DSM 44199 / CIP 105218 / JCM 12690 / 3849) TaxID=1122247 RepID=K5BKJ4_MYCHD|nr:hypothetical protein C731_1144 [Mycolicibacterium hassiacum DSM 44199]
MWTRPMTGAAVPRDGQLARGQSVGDGAQQAVDARSPWRG